MTTAAHQPEALNRIYQRRFGRTSEYRNLVWQVLTASFFNRWVEPHHVVLDLGCGYGEFINNIAAATKLAMDLNPESRGHLAADVRMIEQDCSLAWAIEDNTLDVVFTSNFFEHLPNKASLSETLRQAYRCLRPGGRLIAMGPNIRYVRGAYWDFFDHHTPLSDISLSEALEIEGFVVQRVVPRFLPYTLVNAPRYPLALLRIYLALPWIWPLVGRQFLLVAAKP